MMRAWTIVGLLTLFDVEVSLAAVPGQPRPHEVVSTWQRDFRQRPPLRVLFDYRAYVPRHTIRLLDGRRVPEEDRVLEFTGRLLHRSPAMRWEIQGPIEWMAGRFGPGRITLTFDGDRFRSLWSFDDGSAGFGSVFQERSSLALGNGAYALVLALFMGEPDPRVRRAFLLPSVDSLVIEGSGAVADREVLLGRMRWPYSQRLSLLVYFDPDPPHRIWRAEQRRTGGREPEIVYELQWDEAGYPQWAALQGWRQRQTNLTIEGEVHDVVTDPQLTVECDVMFPPGTRVRMGRREDAADVKEYVADPSGGLRPVETVAQDDEPSLERASSARWLLAVAVGAAAATVLLLTAALLRRKLGRGGTA